MRHFHAGSTIRCLTATDIGRPRTIVGLEQTKALRPRGDGVPVFAFDPAAGTPPVGVVRVRGDDMPPGAPAPGCPHSHDFIVVTYFERAGGSLLLRDERWSVRPGDVIVIAPGEVIAYEPDARAPDRAGGWGVFFLPEAFGSSGSEVRLSWRAHPLLFPFVGGAAGAVQRLHVPPAGRTAWSARVAALHEELHRDDSGHHEAVRAHLTLLLVEVARLAGAVAADLRFDGDPLLGRVFGVIEQRYREAISLADVARAVRLTPGHLTTVVRQRTGRTVLEWITERRMAEARRLLARTDLPVGEVGRRIGYGDPAYFTRCFRRIHDTPPSGWRRSTPR
jgi:AraC family transcriptional regulator, transcriptional activator of pobA